MFFLTIIHLHATFTFAHIHDYSRPSLCLLSDAAERVPLYYRTSLPQPLVAPYSDWYGFSPGIYPRHGCSLWIYPPSHWVYTRTLPTHWVYTRRTPFALVIYEDSTHINPDMGHGINTGMHICPDSGLSTTSMVECLFFCLRDNFFMLAIYLSLVQSAIKSLTH